ncbi:hypothetical protein R3Q06_11290 [Rhodococcus erythropolis]|uniref:hypothetical protein n=1 Tax=Rhodococcus erythropolis TaxID=1833 RepID=UPI002949C236|nr:hypothetical protein [Rhodococcus erythropolis]MDV6274084.1 hypothetical protein [Rhodococcus erythropolis]
MNDVVTFAMPFMNAGDHQVIAEWQDAGEDTLAFDHVMAAAARGAFVIPPALFTEVAEYWDDPARSNVMTEDIRESIDAIRAA